jgi:hypothetical protein
MAVLTTNLPHWFRFSPTDEELIEQILKPKITGNDKEAWFIREIDFYKHEPCELPRNLLILNYYQTPMFVSYQEKRSLLVLLIVVGLIMLYIFAFFFFGVRACYSF